MTQTSKMTSTPPGQYLALNLRVKGQEDNGELIVEGVANDADVTDSFNTRIKVSQRGLTSFMDNPVCLYMHDMANPVGVFRSVGYVGSKLKVQAAIHPDARTPSGANIADLVRSGVLRAFSIRFDEYKETRGKDYTQIDADALDEISIVTLPSNKASLFSMRSKGIQMHGVEELMTEEAVKVADKRNPDTVRSGGVLSLQLLTQRLGALISDTKSDGDWYSGAYLVAVYDDVVVWTEYAEATFYQQGYAVDATGAVTLTGTEQEVLPSWTVVGGADNDDARAATRDTGDMVETTYARVHPDDMAEIARQCREAMPTAERSAAPLSAPESSPVSEPVTTEAEPVALNLDEVRAQLRSAIQQVTGAPVG